ncbi:MAG: SRPBCC family protein [Dehalococcoidia bacterium]
MKTIHHAFEIAAPRETVFTSLTTTEGLSAWWTTGAKADEAAVGARIDLRFRGPFNPQMRITEFDPHAHVRWEGVGGHEAWGETTIRFELDATGGGTQVRFWQQLGPELSDEAVATANFNWGYYLDSLRLLCETGSGKPFQAGIVGARVGASGIG